MAALKDVPQDTEARVRDVIKRTLTTYPRLSITMIGSHARPYSTEWRAVLEKMVQEGEVLRTTEQVSNRTVFVHTLPQLAN